MRFMLGVASALTVALVSSAAPAAAQSNDEAFKREVLARLQRIEDQLSQQSGGGGSGGSFAASVDLFCGYGASADCSSQAKTYCKNQGFTLGLPAQDTVRQTTKYLIRVTCIR